ncbi:hypothetical protein LXL04_020508 [Taraxacum kok-saghyz]
MKIEAGALQSQGRRLVGDGEAVALQARLSHVGASSSVIAYRRLTVFLHIWSLERQRLQKAYQFLGMEYTVALLVLGIAMGSIEYGTSYRLGKVADGIRNCKLILAALNMNLVHVQGANIDPDLLLATSWALLMRDVKNKIWKKSSSQSTNVLAAATSARDSPPMTVTYRHKGLDREATERMIKELDEDREESQDPEVEFAIAGAVREWKFCWKLFSTELVPVFYKILGMVPVLYKIADMRLRDDLKSNQDAIEPAEGILLIVESLTMEANESDNINITQNALTVSNQQRNTEMVAIILPYLTYGELAAMEALGVGVDEHELMWRETKRRYFRNRVAIRHLKESFAFTAESGFRFDSFDRSRWDTWRLKSVSVLPLLHALEGVAGEKRCFRCILAVYLHFGTYSGNILALLFSDNIALLVLGIAMGSIVLAALNMNLVHVQGANIDPDLLLATSWALLMRDVKNKIWKKSSSQSTNALAAATSARDSPPMTVTYRHEGLDREATERMIKELDEDREESQDPEVEFAIVGAVREWKFCWKLFSTELVPVFYKILGMVPVLYKIADMVPRLRDDLKSNQDAIEPAEGILLIVESLTMEANESDNINITQNALTVSNQQRNTEMVARILPYLTYGELAAIEALGVGVDEHELMWRETKRRYFRNRVAIRHLKESFAFTAESGFRFDSFDRSRWDTWRLKSVSVLPLLHALEGVAGEKRCFRCILAVYLHFGTYSGNILALLFSDNIALLVLGIAMGSIVLAALNMNLVHVQGANIDPALLLAVHSKGVNAELVHSSLMDLEMVKPLQLTRLVHGRLVTKHLRLVTSIWNKKSQDSPFSGLWSAMSASTAFLEKGVIIIYKR